MTNTADSQRPPSKKKLSAATSWLLLVLLFVYLAISCSVKPYMASINYDDGWVAALNYLPFSQYVAGRDYVFTYGPLYFLNVCLDIEPSRLLTWLFYIFENLSLAWVLFFYRRSVSLAKFFLLAAALIVSQLLSHTDFRTTWGSEYVRIIVLVLLLAIPLLSNTKALILSSIIAGIYATILMFIKFDLALEVMITVLAYFILAKPFGFTYPKLPCFIFLGVWFSSFLLMAAMIFKEPVNCFHWICTNFQHISLYTDAHDVPVSLPFFLPLAIVLLLIYLLVVLKNTASRDMPGYIGLTLLPSVMIIFKHGFVLANSSHMNNFYRFLLLAIACVLIFSRKRSDLVFLSIPFVTLIFLVPSLDYAQSYGWQEVNNPSRLASLQLNDSFLPSDKGETTFDGVPYNMMWCFVNGLSYKPNPLVLLYHAATSERDRLAAQYFSETKAPDYLFCEHSAWYRRNMFMETPSTWANILNCYQIKNYEPQKYLLLLKKQCHFAPLRLVTGEPFICNVNQWYAVPPSSHPLYCSFDLRPNLLGMIYRWLYKLTSISINLKYADGHIQNFKLVPGVLKNGILINYLPEDMPALKLLFENKAKQAVSQIELTGPGFKYYEQPIRAIWKTQSDKLIEKQVPEPALTYFPPSTLTTGQFSIPYVFMYSPSRDYTFWNADKITPAFRKSEEELMSLTLAVFEGNSFIPPTSLYVQIDNGPMIATARGINLIDRSGRLPTREATVAGFMTTVNIRNLNTGLHIIRAVAQSRKDGKWYQIPDAARFSVE